MVPKRLDDFSCLMEMDVREKRNFLVDGNQQNRLEIRAQHSFYITNFMHLNFPTRLKSFSSVISKFVDLVVMSLFAMIKSSKLNVQN
jgi:hypothetical protein